MLQKFKDDFDLKHTYVYYADSDRATDLLLDAGEEELETTAAEAPEKLKIARSKKTPSRYNDCMLDLSDIADPLVEEVKMID